MDPTLLLSVLAIAVGFVLLIWGADRFIAGAAALAQDLGVPKLLVGLTVVGLGTSAPEMFVAAVAALQGKSGLAIGNAIGSNVTNIALILGVTALVTPLVVNSSVLKRELPVLLQTPREKQVGHVHARGKENERRGRREDPEHGRPGLADHVLL